MPAAFPAPANAAPIRSTVASWRSNSATMAPPNITSIRSARARSSEISWETRRIAPPPEPGSRAVGRGSPRWPRRRPPGWAVRRSTVAPGEPSPWRRRPSGRCRPTATRPERTPLRCECRSRRSAPGHPARGGRDIQPRVEPRAAPMGGRRWWPSMMFSVIDMVTALPSPRRSSGITARPRSRRVRTGSP